MPSRNELLAGPWASHQFGPQSQFSSGDSDKKPDQFLFHGSSYYPPIIFIELIDFFEENIEPFPPDEEVVTFPKQVLYWKFCPLFGSLLKESIICLSVCQLDAEKKTNYRELQSNSGIKEIGYLQISLEIKNLHLSHQLFCSHREPLINYMKKKK